MESSRKLQRFHGSAMFLSCLCKELLLNARYANDSTPLLLELQAQHGNTRRSLFPTSAGTRFLCALLEDFADEWLTKVMFEGRFHTLKDAKFGAAWQVLQNPLQSKNSDEALQAIDMFAARQRERRALVGCSDWACISFS